MIKKLSIYVLVLATLVVFIGCEMSDIDKDTDTDTDTDILETTTTTDVMDYKDPETGVHYLIFEDQAGYCGMGGITVRYNSDGTIMID